MQPQDQPPTPEHPEGFTTRYDGSGRTLTDRARQVHEHGREELARRVADLNVMGSVGSTEL